MAYWHPHLKKLLVWCYETNAGEGVQRTYTIIIKLQHNVNSNGNAYNEGGRERRPADPIEEQLFPEELASEQHWEVRGGQTDIRAEFHSRKQEQGDQRNMF